MDRFVILLSKGGNKESCPFVSYGFKANAHHIKKRCMGNLS